MLPKRLLASAFVLVFLGNVPLHAQEEGNVQELKELVRKLQEEQQALRKQIEDLNNQLKPRSDDESTPDLRNTPPNRFPSRRWFGGGNAPFRVFEFGPSGPRRTPRPSTQGPTSSYSFHKNKDGSVKVEITKRGADGKETVETYSGKSLQDLREQHPELGKIFTPTIPMPRWSRRPGQLDPMLPFRRFDAAPSNSNDRLGVMVSTLSPEAARRLALDEGIGLLVEEVEDGSLAQDLELEKGDVLLKINGVTIRGVPSVREGLQSSPKTNEVAVEVLRGEKDHERLTLKASLGERRERELKRLRRSE